jgi:hypothetical protein
MVLPLQSDTAAKILTARRRLSAKLEEWPKPAAREDL